MADEPEVILYTDGACSGNPGPGGWAFILRHLPTGRELERSGGESETTNNRMELQAVVEGLSSLNRSVSVRIVSDSAYVLNGLSTWIKSWKRTDGNARTEVSGLKLRTLTCGNVWTILPLLTKLSFPR